MSEQCGNCRFYKARTEDYGKCRRYPPVLLPGAQYPQAVAVDAEDWCGEYERAPELRETPEGF